MIRDLAQLKKNFEAVTKNMEDASEDEKKEAQLTVMDLTVFENTAWLMAKHADANIPNDPDEWLMGFEMFSIYEVLPQILELWEGTNRTTAIPKKK